MGAEVRVQKRERQRERERELACWCGDYLLTLMALELEISNDSPMMYLS
jgi:hypothetical protein